MRLNSKYMLSLYQRFYTIVIDMDNVSVSDLKSKQKLVTDHKSNQCSSILTQDSLFVFLAILIYWEISFQHSVNSQNPILPFIAYRLRNFRIAFAIEKSHQLISMLQEIIPIFIKHLAKHVDSSLRAGFAIRT